jgi:23S rRNA-/tRNA-specific pseudouridylate synthase
LEPNGKPVEYRKQGGRAVPKLARTEWKKLSVESGTTLVEVKLKTGRKNQIRVHFSEAGHPVIGDEKYGGEKASRMYLHALRLGFKHPRTGEWLEFEAPLPGRNGKQRVSDGRQLTADNQRTIDGRQPGNATSQ